ncbi:hypothetical protein QBC34DRAFT_383915 [Podospora aff. communis PSN243]|uniref:Ubiquitin 3 binding protein But2 C-terminal domain-containing protein n=1 Tax=Podospora aff. communis PSN243 TaxID=3040156 RepID=A0AAV9GCF6_9PEZI|nr:hypothetical protein QBC34DRAFT_383915 [Podospora aff. communis PSN243]
MKSLITLLLPTLAFSAALTPRQAHDPNLPEVIRVYRQEGDGCPANTFSAALNNQGNSSVHGHTATILFGNNIAGIDPIRASDPRGYYCKFVAEARFPLGCSTATFRSLPQGFAQIEDGIQAKITNQYVMDPTTAGPGFGQPAEIVLKSDRYGPGMGGDFYNETGMERSFSFRQNIRTEGERIIRFTSDVRYFLTATSEREKSFIVVDAWILTLWDFGKC